MKIYNVSYKAYQQYKLNTRGNKNVGRKLAQIKLSRNIELATVYAENESNVIYQYGQLYIGVLKSLDLIVDVHQELVPSPSPIDSFRKATLNREYGINVGGER